MARRKNTKRIDPRYFLNETTYRDEIEEGVVSGGDYSGATSANRLMGGEDKPKSANVRVSSQYEELANEFINDGADAAKVEGDINTCQDVLARGQKGDFVKCLLGKNTYYANGLRSVGMIPG
tara:strand:+ start:107 stop:472 length:366 start_codon:yes stop_codon:yes gene_type:complete